MTAMELERWDDGSHRPEDHAIQDFFNQAGEAAATGHPWRGRWLKFRGGISGARDFGALREDAIKEYRDASLRWYHAAGEAKAQGQTGRAKWYVPRRHCCRRLRRPLPLKLPIAGRVSCLGRRNNCWASRIGEGRQGCRSRQIVGIAGKRADRDEVYSAVAADESIGW